MPVKSLEENLDEMRPTPSSRFYRRMSHAAWTPAGARQRTFTATGLVVLLAVILLALTPQGYAWAQQALHFFTHAPSDTVPVTPISKTATPDQGYIFNQAIADVAQKAGFKVLQPTWLPADSSGKQLVSFQGASIEPDHNIVRIFYRFSMGGDDMTDGLVLREQTFQTVDDCQLCGMVGASAIIESFQVGNVSGEYVEGVWKADNNGNWNWVPDPYVQTLRWQMNNLAIEMQYFGTELNKTDLLTIAQSLK